MASSGNGLNLLRLILAALVIVGHSPALAGLGSLEGLGGQAVSGFFAISGYLVTQSRLRTTGWTFSLRRAARIYPGYWLCLVVTAFPLALLVGAHRGGWTARGAVGYVASNLTIFGFHGTVGSTLDGAPVGSTWNGSLWTLPWELMCYVGIGLMLVLPAAGRRLRLLSVVTVAGLVGLGTLVANGSGRTVGPLNLTTCFAAGILIYAWRHAIPVDGRLAVLAALVFAVGRLSPVAVPLTALPCAYLALWFGVACPNGWKRIGERNDVSYGVYLYGWPVQQTLSAYDLDRAGIVVYTGAALVGALALAWVSWLAVERPVNTRVKRLSRRDTSGGEAARLG